jgi:hypothetical protein
MIRCECHDLSWDQCPTLLQGLASLERMREGMEQIIKDAGLPRDRTDALCRSLDGPLCPCCNTTLGSGDCPKCGGI